jgi:hypothetical protein
MHAVRKLNLTPIYLSSGGGGVNSTILIAIVVTTDQHWRRVLDPAICKDKFSDDEKVLLAWSIKVHGIHSWKRVAKMLTARTGVLPHLHHPVCGIT